MPRLPRADAYPGHVEYRDTGCHAFPLCLSCPLPRCILDVEHAVTVQLYTHTRARAARELRAKGLTIRAIAERLSVSTRTVNRALSGGD